MKVKSNPRYSTDIHVFDFVTYSVYYVNEFLLFYFKGMPEVLPFILVLNFIVYLRKYTFT